MKARGGTPLLLLAGLLSAGRSGTAAPEAAYTLEQCIRVGLERNAAVVNARRDCDIVAARSGQARAEALPGLSLGSSYTRLDSLEEVDFGDEAMRFGTLDNYDVTAELSQLLYSGGRVKAALKAAGLARERARWTRDEVEAALVRDIRIGFYSILLARAAVQVRDESLAQLTAFEAQTREKFRTGAASEFDVMTAQVHVANEKPERIRARAAYDLAVEAFRRLINLEGEGDAFRGELSYAPRDWDLSELRAEAMQRRPALLAARRVIDLREQDLRTARSGALPDLRTYFLYTGANSYRFVSFDDAWAWHWNAGVRLSWDIWDGGLTRGLVREKRIELEKSRTDAEDLETAVQLEIRQAFLEMKRAEEVVSSSEDTVALAGKALKIAGARYESGAATRLEFADANLALNTARLSRQQALRDHMAAVAKLEFACGRGNAPREGKEGDNDGR